MVPLPPAVDAGPAHERRHPRPHAMHGPRFLSLSPRLAAFVGVVSCVGVAAGLLGAFFGTSTDWIGLLAIVALVGAGQALALEVDDGSISVSAVGAIAGAALFGARAALALAITTARSSGAPADGRRCTTCSSTSARSPSRRSRRPRLQRRASTATCGRIVYVVAGIAAGATYFAVNMGLLSLAVAIEGHERWWAVFRERFAWLATHYLVYGFIGGVIWVGYDADGTLGSRGLRGAAAPDAQDAGGLPAAHAAERAEAARRRPRRSRPRTSRSSTRTGCSGSARPPPWRACRRRSTRATPTPPATRAACSSSRSRSAASSASRRRSSTCSATRRSSTTSASSRSRTRSCSSPRA